MAVNDLVGGLRGGVAFLSRLPVDSGEADWERFRTLPVAFPLVGYLIGALVALPFFLPAPSATVAFAYLLALAVVVGIPHFDGVADLGDAVAAHGPSSRRAALKDTDTGVGAIVAVAVVFLGLVLAALALSTAPLAVAVAVVIAAEVGAKLGMATVGCLGTAGHEGMGSQFTTVLDSEMLVVPALAAVPAAVAVLPATLAAVLAGPLVAVVLVDWADEQLGGVSGDIFGATNELARVAGLHLGVVAWTLW